MRVVCHLRTIRGDRTMVSLARAARVSEADLSRIERGISLPRDEDIEGLERAYGVPITDWYGPTVLLALTGDDAA